jgi:hypothetical protein
MFTVNVTVTIEAPDATTPAEAAQWVKDHINSIPELEGSRPYFAEPEEI